MNKEAIPRDHQCSINHTGSSSSMEPMAITEGFRNSVADRGLRYRYIVADGDSSMYHSVLKENPYCDVNMRLMKISCKNHALRRFCTNMCSFTNTLSSRRRKYPFQPNTFIKPKELVSNKIFQIRMGIDRACSYRGRFKQNLKQSINELRQDIMNALRHVFGDHRKCASYFCDKKDKSDKVNMVQTLQELKIFMQIEEVVLRIAQLAESLIHNMNNNVVESFNATLTHSSGKKSINYTGWFGYQGRCHRGVVHFNEMDSYRVLHKHLQGASPGAIYKRTKGVQIRKRLHNRENKVPRSTRGATPAEPDKTGKNFAIATEKILQSLQVTPEEAIEIEAETHGQAESDRWHQERANRLTAFHFKKYCSMRNTTSLACTVKELVQKSFWGNDDTDYGNFINRLRKDFYKRKLSVKLKIVESLYT